MELISLHFPKTAGTSFRKTLEDNYGDKLLQDYQNIDINNINLNKYNAVHGHLSIHKYFKIYPNAKVITWLRNPLDRIISYYNFWNSHNKYKNMGVWHDKFVKEKPTFREFITKWTDLHKEFTIYTKNFDHNNFFFVGITERYNKDIEKIGEKLNWSNIIKYNENTSTNNMDISDKDIKLFNEIFKDEINFYKYFKNI